MEKKHDGLLQLVEEIAEFDPLAALNLLRASGVTRFGHILSALSPLLISAGFCLGRDAAVLQAFAQVQRFAPDPDSSTQYTSLPDQHGWCWP